MERVAGVADVTGWQKQMLSTECDMHIRYLRESKRYCRKCVSIQTYRYYQKRYVGDRY